MKRRAAVLFGITLVALAGSLHGQAIGYVDPTITAGSTTMKAAHIEQLRNGVK